MKLLPLTLTLFDKVTNNTYKGTVLLKNLNNDMPDESVLNATTIDEGYDGKGAGLFIILVISVYALSIVLFIASFITKKSGVGESLNEESTVTTYLHKVGDLKEKTAREHFKKLKMSIISKVEADSQNQQQKRGRKGSKGAKELSAISRTSSKSSLGENKIHSVDRAKPTNGTEHIPSTGLLPKEDDARQPLLSGDPETPTPPVRDTLSPSFEPWGPHGRSASPSLLRANSPRALDIIKEQDNEQGEDSDGSRKARAQSHGSLKRKAAGSVDNLHERTMEEPFANGHHSEGEEESPRVLRARNMSESDIMGPTQEPGFHNDKSASLGRPQKPRQLQSPQSKFPAHAPRPDPRIERPRPKHSSPDRESPEDVWEHMPQKLIPPPKQRGIKNPKNLYVQIPPSALNSPDVWVLRNNNQRAMFVQERSPSPSNRAEPPRDERQPIHQQPHQTQNLAQRPNTLETNKMGQDRSLRDRSQRELSPPNQHSMYLSPQENLNLPRPFRTPSPRTPSEQFLPRVLDLRSPPHDPGSPGRYQVAQGAEFARDKERKAVVKITLDRSPDLPSSPQAGGDHGWANRAYDQSPRPGSSQQSAEVVERRERTPPRFTFSEGARNLDVPRPQFPVTFNSPGLPRRKEEQL